MDGKTKNKDGTWNREALRTEHRVLINAGNLAPIRMLATKYAVSVTTIKMALAENNAVDPNDNFPSSISHDPFRRC
jgi:hypothetical protein